jgi:hypothetical protein
MEPYIKEKSPLRGERKPGLTHGAGLPRIEQRQRNEVAAARPVCYSRRAKTPALRTLMKP